MRRECASRHPLPHVSLTAELEYNCYCDADLLSSSSMNAPWRAPHARRNIDNLIPTGIGSKTDHEKNALQRQIDETDKQINQLVYELYGLTDDEIKIVEETDS
jgi:hypothetical protein